MPPDALVRGSLCRRALAFLTRSQELGFCGGCGRGVADRLVDTDHRHERLRLGPDVNAARDLAWSPDGSQLGVHNDDETGNSDIYVMDVGSEPGEITSGEIRRLTTDPAIDEFPAWTPDGTAVLYDNAGADALDDSGFSDTQEIWRVPADGGDPFALPPTRSGIRCQTWRTTGPWSPPGRARCGR